MFSGSVAEGCEIVHLAVLYFLGQDCRPDSQRVPPQTGNKFILARTFWLQQQQQQQVFAENRAVVSCLHPTTTVTRSSRKSMCAFSCTTRKVSVGWTPVGCSSKPFSVFCFLKCLIKFPSTHIWFCVRFHVTGDIWAVDVPENYKMLNFSGRKMSCTETEGFDFGSFQTKGSKTFWNSAMKIWVQSWTRQRNINVVEALNDIRKSGQMVWLDYLSRDLLWLAAVHTCEATNYLI